MVENLSEIQIMQLITTIVNKHGCEIKEIDLENQVLDIDGPPEARMKCAIELQDFLDDE